MVTLYQATVVGLLSGTALLKLGTLVFLEVPFAISGLLPITTETFIAASAILEGIVVVAIIKSRTQFTRNLLILWISSMFVLYHFANWWIGVNQACPCLAGADKAFGLNREAVMLATWAILLYCFVGSGLCFLLMHFRGTHSSTVV